jgi:hypothetical protein
MNRSLIITAAILLTFAGLTAAQQTSPTPAAPPTQGQTGVGPNFVDADGDGICDRCPSRAGQKRGRGNGPGDGTGNRGVGPRDGTGYGPGTSTCTGVCTGTGPGQRQGQGTGARRGPRR